jgi:multiple sugar transport system ATP-binding protein
MFSANGLAIDCSRYAFDGAGAMDGEADFGIRPEHVLHGVAAARLPVRFEAEVELVEPMGSDMLVWTRTGSHALTFITDSNEKLSVGERCQIGFDPARASIFAQETGTRL